VDNEENYGYLLPLSPHLSGKSEFFEGELGILGEPFLTVPFLTLSYRATYRKKITDAWQIKKNCK
jgi:hypothetical protein